MKQQFFYHMNWNDGMNIDLKLEDVVDLFAKRHFRRSQLYVYD